jgi:acyl-homoserine-lactone acylase
MLERMGSYEADIRFTTHGVAHIRAADWGSLGYGQGWACARDNLATILDMAVKVRSERSRFHGPGPDDNFVASDFGYLALDITGRANALRDAQPPDIRSLVAGYTAGCNAWLAEARATRALPGWCADAEWLAPIEEIDLYRYLVDATLMGSGRNLVGLIGRAEAPGPDGPVVPSPLSAMGASAGASNGWAFGGEATASGGGLVMANPHFPWYGEARFWECHLTIPGDLDVYGVSLVGIPGVQIGFNQHLAWTHTFSRGSRFTLYRLDLLPGDPTSYRFGDEPRAMTPSEHQVTVRGDDGSLDTVSRRLWSSHHGPMVNLPLLGWGNELAFTYRDANLDNTEMLQMFLDMDRATSIDEMRAAQERTKAMPWANTLAADATGRAWYADSSATPNLSAAAQQRYRDRLVTDPITALLAENRVPLLDGSEPDDAWVDEPGARAPGLVPHDRLPELERRDVLVNANDSHWLTHPDERLEGYSVLHGFERTPRSLRTRQNLIQAGALAASGTLTVESALAAVLDGDALTAHLLRDAVVERLRVDGSHPEAAEVLAAWDGSVRGEAVGAVLWREVLAGFSPAELLDAGSLFAEAFDPDDPVATPSGLAVAPGSGPDPVVAAVGAALAVLGEAGVDIRARLDEVQWAGCGDERVGVPGGGEVEGVANVLAPLGALVSHSLVPLPPGGGVLPARASSTGLGSGGYQVTYGTSFLMAVEVTPDGPRAKGVLAYGQSEDWSSPGAAESVRAYAAGELRPMCFTDAEIEADPNLTRRSVGT